MARRFVGGLVAFTLLAACRPIPVLAPAPVPAGPAGRSEPAQALDVCLQPPDQVFPPISSSAAAQEIGEVADRVEQLRGLPLDGGVEPTFLTREQVSERISVQLEEDYPPEEADADQRLYTALGALPPGFDLRAAVEALLSSQVAGFYDRRTEELVVAADPSAPLDALTRTVLAHELVHAATDAAFGLPDALLDGSADEQLAALALVEGDAVLAQERFALAAIPPDQQLQLSQAEQDLSGYPHVLASELHFPYEHGAAFACTLFAEGGLDGLNAAYRSTPRTTAQILFPDRFKGGEEAVDARDPGVLPVPWTLADEDTFGAADLLWLFEAPGDDPRAALPDPLADASNWAGGEVTVWIDGPRTAVALILVDRGGVGELCDAVADWYIAAFPDDEATDLSTGEVIARDGWSQDAALRCGEGDVRLGIGPDLATARALAE